MCENARQSKHNNPYVQVAVFIVFEHMFVEIVRLRGPFMISFSCTWFGIGGAVCIDDPFVN